eukprot:1262369-Pleurochrysis_carterae.AAC.1
MCALTPLTHSHHSRTHTTHALTPLVHLHHSRTHTTRALTPLTHSHDGPRARALSQVARELLKHDARYLLDDVTASSELCEFARSGKLEHVHLLLEAGCARAKALLRPFYGCESLPTSFS